VKGGARLSRLFEPGRIGGLETRNRIVMAPMGTNLGEEDGLAGKRIWRYYEERAHGGVGLVIVEVAAIAHPAGAAIPRQLGISDDRFLPGLEELARRIHRHGAKAAIQLQHAGKIATRDIAAGRPLLVPSLVPEAGAGMADLTSGEVERLVANLTAPGARLHYRELDVGEIGGLVASFAEAAERARRAGFDGVEIHAGHGYVISAFLSRATNRRTDAYGGSAENRARLLAEVIRAAKERAGGDFPVWCRLDAREYRIEDGITLAESCATARLAEAAGADAIHVSAYGNPYSGIAFTEAPLVHAPGGFLPFAAEIKRHVQVPVIAVGRITPYEGERTLAAGRADFIAMGRPLLADPNLPRKLAEGRRADIRPCVYCYTCVGKIFVNESVVCAVNPATGREEEFEIALTPTPKNVLIAGGGPAGMEAARVAALRGHRVTLCEKGHRLGGTLMLASLLWEPHGDLLRHLETQVRRLSIALRFGQAVTPELVAELRPDVILVAVGARHEMHAIPGIERANVIAADDLRVLLTGGRGEAAAAKFPAWQRALLAIARALGVFDRPALIRSFSRRWMPLGRRVAIVGGGLVGVELAQFLAERGREVTVLEEGEWLAPEMAIPRRWRCLHELRERGVALRTGVGVEAITDDGVAIVGRDGKKETIAAGHVILATAASPDSRLADALRAQGAEVRLLGDCAEIRYLEGAIADGARAVLAL